MIGSSSSTHEYNVSYIFPSFSSAVDSLFWILLDPFFSSSSSHLYICLILAFRYLSKGSRGTDGTIACKLWIILDCLIYSSGFLSRFLYFLAAVIYLTFVLSWSSSRSTPSIEGDSSTIGGLISSGYGLGVLLKYLWAWCLQYLKHSINFLMQQNQQNINVDMHAKYIDESLTYKSSFSSKP